MGKEFLNLLWSESLKISPHCHIKLFSRGSAHTENSINICWVIKSHFYTFNYKAHLIYYPKWWKNCVYDPYLTSSVSRAKKSHRSHYILKAFYSNCISLFGEFLLILNWKSASLQHHLLGLMIFLWSFTEKVYHTTQPI